MVKFLIIGNANAVTYNCIFPLVADGTVHIRTKNGTVCYAMTFYNEDGENKIIPSLWYTNLPSEHLKKELILTKTYDQEKYPMYDNYPAINVNCIKDIPKDYNGIMGVPMSVLLFNIQDKYEVLGYDHTVGLSQFEQDGKGVYKRVLIQDSNDKKCFTEPYVDGKMLYARTLIQCSDPKPVYNARVDGKKEYARIMNHNSTHPLVGGGYINGTKIFKRIPIRRKDED